MNKAKADTYLFAGVVAIGLGVVAWQLYKMYKRDHYIPLDQAQLDEIRLSHYDFSRDWDPYKTEQPYPRDLFTAKRYLVPGFYTTSNWMVERR